MSGAEIIAVVACVAAVVSAYNDGSRILTAIRSKWHDRRRQIDQSITGLEWSLARGYHEIYSQYDQHRRELGPRYEEGDSIAREQIKDIIINLQSALLPHLREAQEKGVTLDLMALQIESEQGRVRTLVILRDLYQRLAGSSSMIPSLSMSIEPNNRRWAPHGRAGFNSPDELLLSETICHPCRPPITSKEFVLESICSSSMETIGPKESDISSSPSKPTRRRSSAIGSVVSSVSDIFHSRSTRGSSASVRSSIPESECTRGIPQPISPIEQIPELDVRPVTRPLTSQLKSEPILHDEIMGNPWHDESKKELNDPNNHTQQSHLFFVSPPIRCQSPPPLSVASTDSTLSNPSSRRDQTKATHPIWPPSKANNYLGFCKGAWKVYTGFAGFKVYSEPGSGYYTQRSWLRCKECAFEAPMAKASSGNLLFDESVRTHRSTGVRYRSEFLAKSHVPCKRDSASCFSPLTPRGAFCCVFCCATHQGYTQVYGNLDTFLAHVSECHGQVDRETLALLPNTRCVVGRVAGDSEYFDVNILPR